MQEVAVFSKTHWTLPDLHETADKVTSDLLMNAVKPLSSQTSAGVLVQTKTELK